MLKRTFALLLAGMLLASVGLHATHAQTDQSSQTTEAARVGVERLGVGQQAKTEITLRDSSKLKGYVSAARSDSFTLTDKKTGSSQTIAYSDVVNVKKPHSGIKPRTWIIIAAAAAAAVTVGIIIKPALCDGC